jgi:putative heme iron utilization protein
MREQALSEARLLLRNTEVGVVSTLSKNLRGYPFGSVTPFLSDSEGNLYFYISDIAQHAANMLADSRMSLTVYKERANGDQNENARLTIVGDGHPMTGEEHDEMLDRYVRRFPDADGYKNAHDFKMWKVTPKRIRYIGGFGKIFWLEKEEWESLSNPWDKKAEDGMIEHMNEDHQDAMTLILQNHNGEHDDDVIMSGVTTDGCYLQTKGNNVFIPFAGMCIKSGDVRKYLVDLTHAARKAA